MCGAPTLVHAVLAVLLGMTPYSADDESLIDREARMLVIAQSIVRAVRAVPSRQPELERIAAVVAIGEIESRYALHTHQGICRENECDDGRAVGMWQVWAKRSAQHRARGTDAGPTYQQALLAVRALEYGYERCGGSLLGAHSIYHSGHTCDLSTAGRRVRMTRRYQSALRKGLEQ